MENLNEVSKEDKGKSRLNEILNKICKVLVENPYIHKIILFGSLAGGKHNLSSDIDLLIIGDFKGRIIERRTELYKLLRKFNKKVDIDLIPLTQVELDELIKKDAPFIKEIYQKGRTIYERSG